jgi:DNA-directed RNA polymerase subunit RPC12/RpoP
MKISIDVGHGWCAAMSKCRFCGSEYTLIRERKQKVELVRCPVCRQIVTIKELETPWVGLIEEMK